jgi:hypothetical protein
VITPAVDRLSLDTTDIPIIARKCSAAGQVSVPSATTAQWISKLRRRQFNRLTEDVNVEISGRDLGRVPDEGAADCPGRLNSTQSRRSLWVSETGGPCPFFRSLAWATGSVQAGEIRAKRLGLTNASIQTLACN